MGLDTGIDLTSWAASSMFGYIAYLFLFVILLVGIALGVWWWSVNRQYNKEIVVFENISGQGWVVSYKDKAKFLRLSKDGTEVFYLKKKKIPLTAYGKKMANNQYWFAIGQDGGWYNFVLGDLDAKQQILDIEPIDRDIKYITVAMRKNAAEDYGPKVTMMDKYGTWIIGGVTMLIMLGGIWFILEQMGNLAGSLSSTQTGFAKLVEPIERSLAHVDSICSGGTGVIPA